MASPSGSTSPALKLSVVSVTSVAGLKGLQIRLIARLAPADQDALLKRLEKGELALAGVDGKAFFAQLLQNTLEGFWSDPIYGGNRDLVGWKLIGFPGARYDNSSFVAQHGEKYPLPPVGIKGRVEWIRS